ncbi:MAG: DUF86 domain-containing protein [Proteobacteria bacterium]|nr:DUF86 domain-containing protein [Pseudomonadota bacterium]MBU4258943.1 DUF86 domain-containing protein [Pseudomonadota bacterium]MBU4288693.1 DUF86 domain-containing protein [Pseudomonadota bacterium]
MRNGIILNKLSRVEEYLTKLEEITPDNFEDYNKDWKVQMAAERLLQILIEIIIDTADRLIALRSWGPTVSSSDSIQLLALKKVISAEEPYLKMVKFRNFIVHNYEKVNNAIVYAILTKSLDDIRKFRDEILNYE